MTTTKTARRARRAKTLTEQRAERAGCVQLRRNRETDTVIGVYENEAAGLDDSGGALPYSTVCEDHSFVIAHPTLALAKRHASNPTGWCEECMKPAALRNSEAYAADPEKATGLWEMGFRPLLANQLRVGMEVAYRIEWFGFAAGAVLTDHVTQIDPYPDDDPWGFVVHHSDPTAEPAEVDEESEVWAKEGAR